MPADPAAGSAADQGAVDVVIPVYRPGPELGRCLDSVRRHTDLSRHRLVVVLEPPAHGAVAPEPGVVVLANERRLGFVGSVNRGLAASANDVVLLNSDTQVTRGWVEKLRRAASSRPRVATVSPFSNNATICSLPRFLEENTLPAGHDVDSFAALVERVARREYPPLPTGVGVCLYVRRAAIDDVGVLDERSFGLGYGEESELCMRAAAAGWSHLLDDATFIFHEGQRSFGTSRRRRVAAAHRTMRRLHPDYLERIARFIAEDPLRPVRQRVLAALDPPRRGAAKNRVVHLVHGWPPFSQAGTELYAHWLVSHQLADREIGVYARIGDPDRWLGEARERHEHGARVRLVVNNFRQRDPISRNALHDRRLARDFGRFLDERRPDLIHVHHLAGHCASLLAVAARRGVPVVYQVQDWWPICARVNLLHRRGFLCSGPAPAKCADCLPMTALPGGPLWNPLLYAARQRLMRRLLRLPDVLVAGSRFIAESYRHHRMLPPEADLRVLPYGVPLGDRAAGRRRRPVAAPPLRFGYVGSIQPHKGVHLAAGAFAAVDPARATLELWGDAGANPDYTASLRVAERPAIALRGRFPEERKAEVLAALDVLLVPSLGLESFGLVVREAAAVGVPSIVARRGALSELVDGEAPEWASFDPDAPDELRAQVRRLVERPELVDEWAGRLAPPRGFDAHAREIDALYDEVIGRRGRRGRGRPLG